MNVLEEFHDVQIFPSLRDGLYSFVKGFEISARLAVVLAYEDCFCSNFI